MKVAINSLPRSGTKVLQRNFQRYLIQQGTTLSKDNVDSIWEPFSFTPMEYDLGVTNQGIIEITSDEIVYGKKYTFSSIPLHLEVQNRFNLLYERPENWVFKRTPWVQHDPILYACSTLLDKCVAIKKKYTIANAFQFAISLGLATQLNIWANSPALDSAIKQHRADKIELDLELFASQYRLFNQYNNIVWSSDIQVVDFDQMVELSSSREFCKFFDLPYLDFEFVEFQIEYGANKLEMISNLDEIRIIADRVDRFG